MSTEYVNPKFEKEWERYNFEIDKLRIAVSIEQHTLADYEKWLDKSNNCIPPPGYDWRVEIPRRQFIQYEYARRIASCNSIIANLNREITRMERQRLLIPIGQSSLV